MHVCLCMAVPPSHSGGHKGRGMKMNDVIGNGAPVGVALCAAAYAPDNAFALLILMAAVLALCVPRGAAPRGARARPSEPCCLGTGCH